MTTCTLVPVLLDIVSGGVLVSYVGDKIFLARKVPLHVMRVPCEVVWCSSMLLYLVLYVLLAATSVAELFSGCERAVPTSV